MSKSSSSKYYQDNKEILQKRLIKDIKVFIKKKKKRDNMQYSCERCKNPSEN